LINELSSLVRARDVEMLRSWLPRYPSLVHTPDDDGELPLETALSLPADEAEPMVRLLLEHGADLFAIGSLSLPIIEEPILAAQFEGDESGLDLLLRLGLDVNILLPPERNGIVLLMRAARASRQMVDLLLSYGAEVNVQDACGWTPLMFACALDQADGGMTLEDHLHVVNELLRAGADVGLRNDRGYRAIDILRASWWNAGSRDEIEGLLLAHEP
jgi:ankyrin repeat protein